MNDSNEFAKLCEAFRRETSRRNEAMEKAEKRDEFVLWVIVAIVLVGTIYYLTSGVL